jgi:hypothetical protein
MSLSGVQAGLGATIAALALGIIGVGLAWAFSAGAYRAPARNYWNERLPWYVRNVAFAAGPFGAMFLVGVSMTAVRFLPSWSHAATIAVLAAAFFGLFLMGIAWMRRPPRMLKPPWLLEKEATSPVPGHASGALGVFDRILVGLVVSATVLALVIVVIAGVLAVFVG